MVLPVDIAFINQKSSSKEVAAMGPAQWFEQNKRDAWPEKQALSLQPGSARIQSVQLAYRDEDQIQAAVIMANYAHLDLNEGQMVVLPPESQNEEIIFVTAKGIYR